MADPKATHASYSPDRSPLSLGPGSGMPLTGKTSTRVLTLLARSFRGPGHWVLCTAPAAKGIKRRTAFNSTGRPRRIAGIARVDRTSSPQPGADRRDRAGGGISALEPWQLGHTVPVFSKKAFANLAGQCL
jgi:hypothetical protein